MAGKRRKFNKEFKIQACKIVLEEGLNAMRVAEKMGVGFQVLYRWLDDYKTYGEQAFVGSGHLHPKDAELKKALRKIQQLEVENEILKKAAAYFAKHPELE